MISVSVTADAIICTFSALRSRATHRLTSGAATIAKSLLSSTVEVTTEINGILRSVTLCMLL